MATVREIINDGSKYLKSAGIENPRLEAEIFLADLLNLERIELYAYPETEIQETIDGAHRKRIEQRSLHVPTAQILGYKYFFKSKFFINENVLIPRPETEGLVEGLINFDLPVNSLILDLCCGSGNIGISLLLERGDFLIHLADLSEEALKVARQNVFTLCPEKKSSISFIKSNLFSDLPENSYNAIVCNPPYIHPDEKSTLAAEVLNHEPHMALFHTNPVGICEEIIAGSYSRLKSGGILFMEISPRFAVEIELYASKIFSRTEIRNDLAGQKRYLVAIV